MFEENKSECECPIQFKDQVAWRELRIVILNLSASEYNNEVAIKSRSEDLIPLTQEVQKKWGVVLKFLLNFIFNFVKLQN